MFRKRRFHTRSFWQGFTAEQLPGLGQNWREGGSHVRAEAKPAAFIGKPRGSQREGKEQAAGGDLVPQDCPGTLPSSLGPSGSGAFCLQVSLWVAESMHEVPNHGFESLPRLGYGWHFVTQLLAKARGLAL